MRRRLFRPPRKGKTMAEDRPETGSLADFIRKRDKSTPDTTQWKKYDAMVQTKLTQEILKTPLWAKVAVIAAVVSALAALVSCFAAILSRRG